jgi:hypothetical protein
MIFLGGKMEIKIEGEDDVKDLVETVEENTETVEELVDTVEELVETVEEVVEDLVEEIHEEIQEETPETHDPHCAEFHERIGVLERAIMELTEEVEETPEPTPEPEPEVIEEVELPELTTIEPPENRETENKSSGFGGFLKKIGWF